MAESDPFRLCMTDLRVRDPDAYFTVLLAPPDRRAPLAALHALHAELQRIPELVSEPMLGAIRLQWWREGLEALDEGRVMQHPALEALHALGGRRYPTSNLMPLVDAFEVALQDIAFEEEDALFAFVDATDGHVMRIAAEAMSDAAIIGPAARAHGVMRLLLSVPRAASNGLVLLPVEALRAHDLDPHALLRGEPGPALAAIVREYSAKAEAAYSEAAAHRLDQPLLSAVLPAATVPLKRAQLAKVADDPFRLPLGEAGFRRQWRLMRANRRRRL